MPQWPLSKNSPSMLCQIGSLQQNSSNNKSWVRLVVSFCTLWWLAKLAKLSWVRFTAHGVAPALGFDDPLGVPLSLPQWKRHSKSKCVIWRPLPGVTSSVRQRSRQVACRPNGALWDIIGTLERWWGIAYGNVRTQNLEGDSILSSIVALKR